MGLNESHHVRTERAAIRDRYTEGINAGVELDRHALPPLIQAIYAAHGPYERGVLLGVLLEEWSRMEEETPRRRGRGLGG